MIDMQARHMHGEYRFILNYQEHLTKFVVLRPLKEKSAIAVTNELIDIFSLFGAPVILQSDNGREFKNRHLTNTIMELWPELKIVHGKPRHSQSQGSVERVNQDVKKMLMASCKDRNTSIFFINTFHVESPIGFLPLKSIPTSSICSFFLLLCFLCFTFSLSLRRCLTVAKNFLT